MNKNVNFPWRSRTPSHFLILSLGVNILTASSSSSSSPHTCSCASSSADLLLCRSRLDRCCTTPTPMQSPRTLVDVLIRSLSWKSQPKSEQMLKCEVSDIEHLFRFITQYFLLVLIPCYCALTASSPQSWGVICFQWAVRGMTARSAGTQCQPVGYQLYQCSQLWRSDWTRENTVVNNANAN